MRLINNIIWVRTYSLPDLDQKKASVIGRLEANSISGNQ